MSAATELVPIVLRELRKSFRSSKGIALTAFSLLCTLAATLLLVKADQVKRDQIPADIPMDQVHEQFQQVAMKVYEEWYNVDVANALKEAPIVFFLIFISTVWVAPLLVAILGFDAVSAETQHKTVRYWTVRTHRVSYFLGKFLGLWSTVSILTFTMSALIWAVCVVRGTTTAAETVSWGLRLWALTLPLSAAWCGIAILVGSMFNSPMVSLLTIFTSFFVLWVVWLIGNASHSAALLHLYPNHFDRYLLLCSPMGLAKGIGGCLAIATASVGAGALRFTMRDL